MVGKVEAKTVVKIKAQSTFEKRRKQNLQIDCLLLFLSSRMPNQSEEMFMKKQDKTTLIIYSN